MLKHILTLALFFLAAFAVIYSTGLSHAAVSTLPLTPKDFIEPKPGADDDAAVEGANLFAFRLTSALLGNKDGENFVCSPFSVWLPLAALVNATDAEYKGELLSALGTAGISGAELNLSVSRTLYRLTNQRSRRDGEEYYYNPLQIANAIFVSNTVTPKLDFAQKFLDYYRGAAFNVDFTSNEAENAINKWASDNTDGLIKNIIQKFNPNTVASIANAIYFSDRWERQFDPGNTETDVFHAPDGDMNADFMLRAGDNLTYYEDEKIQAMPLAFKTGGSMYVIKPKNGDASGFLKSLTNEGFVKMRQGFKPRTGKLLLPKFRLDSGELRLVDALKALDVPLFDAGNPALSGVIEEYPLFITDAIQKAVMEVDEKGTTAAAVTIMMMAAAGAPLPPTEPFEMKCDTPFVFVLCGSGGTILFTGIVNKPK